MQEGSDVVLRYLDGRAERCGLPQGFEPGMDAVEVILEDGTACSVPLDELKAVFFLKNPRRKLEIELGVTQLEKRTGANAKVEFLDGEVIHGRVERYCVADRGFFLHPVATETNNEKIFVVASALRTLDIEG